MSGVRALKPHSTGESLGNGLLGSGSRGSGLAHRPGGRSRIYTFKRCLPPPTPPRGSNPLREAAPQGGTGRGWGVGGHSFPLPYILVTSMPWMGKGHSSVISGIPPLQKMQVMSGPYLLMLSLSLTYRLGV